MVLTDIQTKATEHLFDTVAAADKGPHIRNLFLEKDLGFEHLYSELPKNNKIINRGLCYICGNNFSVLNVGIKCGKCIRTFHFKCLKKHGLYHENFNCKTCSD